MFSAGICWSGFDLNRPGGMAQVFADELVRREALEDLEPAIEVVGCEKSARCYRSWYGSHYGSA